MIHPSGLQTTDHEPSEVFEPKPRQIESAARRAHGEMLPPPPRRLSPFRFFLFAISLALLAYAGSYFVLSKVLG